jgi:hypothetical protein
MTTWIIIWKITFVVSIALFAGMATWISIGGVSDIKKLIKRLEQSEEQSDDNDAS